MSDIPLLTIPITFAELEAFWSARMRGIGIAVVLLFAGCTSSRTIDLSAASPAVLAVDRCRACEGRGPCPVQVSRETCGLFDSSRGYVELKAVLPDGRCEIRMARTCGLSEGERIHFDLRERNLRRDRPACSLKSTCGKRR